MTQSPRLLVDASLPYIKGLLEPVASVTYLPSREITRERLIELGVEGLLIRSVTRCGESLLAGTSVRFIATATAGIDHIDSTYCKANGITFCNAPGCNAYSVAHWVMGMLALRALHLQKPLREETLAIVGVGHVGRALSHMAFCLGVKLLWVDPPRALAEGKASFVSLHDAMTRASIVSFHTSLTRAGADATYHILNAELLSRCTQKPLILNAARGAICHTPDLIEAIKKQQIEATYIDCWEGEPHISEELLFLAQRATPHIAGFSADGKARGTAMVVKAALNFFALDAHQVPWHTIVLPEPQNAIIDLTAIASLRLEYLLAQTMKAPLLSVEKQFRDMPDNFEQLRVTYPHPRESQAYSVMGWREEEASILGELGYQLV